MLINEVIENSASTRNEYFMVVVNKLLFVCRISIHSIYMAHTASVQVTAHFTRILIR